MATSLLASTLQTGVAPEATEEERGKDVGVTVMSPRQGADASPWLVPLVTQKSLPSVPLKAEFTHAPAGQRD